MAELQKLRGGQPCGVTVPRTLRTGQVKVKCLVYIIGLGNGEAGRAAELGEFGANARGLGSSQACAEHKAAPAAKAANNAAARRVRSFRAGLARAVAALHAAWLARRAAAAAAGELR